MSEEQESRRFIESRTSIRFTVGQSITMVIAILAFIGVVATFLVNYRETTRTVGILKTNNDTLNAKLDRISNKLDQQTRLWVDFMSYDSAFFLLEQRRIEKTKMLIQP